MITIMTKGREEKLRAEITKSVYNTLEREMLGIVREECSKLVFDLFNEKQLYTKEPSTSYWGATVEVASLRKKVQEAAIDGLCQKTKAIIGIAFAETIKGEAFIDSIVDRIKRKQLA